MRRGLLTFGQSKQVATARTRTSKKCMWAGLVMDMRTAAAFLTFGQKVEGKRKVPISKLQSEDFRKYKIM